MWLLRTWFIIFSFIATALLCGSLSMTHQHRQSTADHVELMIKEHASLQALETHALAQHPQLVMAMLNQGGAPHVRIQRFQNKIKSLKESFIYIEDTMLFSKNLSKKCRGKKCSYDPLKPWDALIPEKEVIANLELEPLKHGVPMTIKWGWLGKDRRLVVATPISHQSHLGVLLTVGQSLNQLFESKMTDIGASSDQYSLFHGSKEVTNHGLTTLSDVHEQAVHVRSHPTTFTMTDLVNRFITGTSQLFKYPWASGSLFILMLIGLALDLKRKVPSFTESMTNSVDSDDSDDSDDTSINDPHHADPHHADPHHADPHHADPHHADPHHAEDAVLTDQNNSSKNHNIETPITEKAVAFHKQKTQVRKTVQTYSPKPVNVELEEWANPTSKLPQPIGASDLDDQKDQNTFTFDLPVEDSLAEDWAQAAEEGNENYSDITLIPEDIPNSDFTDGYSDRVNNENESIHQESKDLDSTNDEQTSNRFEDDLMDIPESEPTEKLVPDQLPHASQPEFDIFIKDLAREDYDSPQAHIAFDDIDPIEIPAENNTTKFIQTDKVQTDINESFEDLSLFTEETSLESELLMEELGQMLEGFMQEIEVDDSVIDQDVEPSATSPSHNDVLNAKSEDYFQHLGLPQLDEDHSIERIVSQIPIAQHPVLETQAPQEISNHIDEDHDLSDFDDLSDLSDFDDFDDFEDFEALETLEVIESTDEGHQDNNDPIALNTFVESSQIDQLDRISSTSINRPDGVKRKTQLEQILDGRGVQSIPPASARPTTLSPAIQMPEDDFDDFESWMQTDLEDSQAPLEQVKSSSNSEDFSTSLIQQDLEVDPEVSSLQQELDLDIIEFQSHIEEDLFTPLPLNEDESTVQSEEELFTPIPKHEEFRDSEVTQALLSDELDTNLNQSHDDFWSDLAESLPPLEVSDEFNSDESATNIPKSDEALLDQLRSSEVEENLHIQDQNKDAVLEDLITDTLEENNEQSLVDQNNMEINSLSLDPIDPVDLADPINEANLADEADEADLADEANLADLADKADLADSVDQSPIQLEEASVPSEKENITQALVDDEQIAAMQSFLDQGFDDFFTADPTTLTSELPLSKPEERSSTKSNHETNDLASNNSLIGIFGEDVSKENQATYKINEENLNKEELSEEDLSTVMTHQPQAQDVVDIEETPNPEEQGSGEISDAHKPSTSTQGIDWSKRAKTRRKARLLHYKEVFHSYCDQKRQLDPAAKIPKMTQFIEQLNAARQAFIDKTGCPDVRFMVYMKKGRVAVKAKAYTPDT